VTEARTQPAVLSPRRSAEGVPFLVFGALAELPGLVHGISTREGGRSAGPFGSLNVSLMVGDERERVLENRARLARAVADGEELVLWFETDLYDMLQLAQILDRLVPGTATLIITGEERFAGVGELDPAELRELLDGGDAGGLGRRLPVDAALAEAGRAVWTAVRQPEPRALAAVTDTAALPALGDAVRRHQQQYPWRGSNLNRTERALLEAVQAGARTRMHAFVAQQRGEERPFMGDSTAFAYLGALAGGPDALLQDNGSLRLTARGEAVLAGGRAWAGRPERWLGGVRLPAGAPPWSWDPAAGEIV